MTAANSTAGVMSASANLNFIHPGPHLCGRCSAPVTKFFKSGKASKYCHSCNDKNQGRIPPAQQSKVCGVCGGSFVSTRLKKYCSKRCCWTAQDRKAGSVPRHEYAAARRKPANYFTCEHCGKDAHRNISGTNTGPNRWCSMQCRKDAAAAARPAPFSPCYARHCRTCSRPFVSKTRKANCSRECELQALRAGALESAQAQHRATAKVVACDACEAEFCPLYGTSHATMCLPCAQERARIIRRIAKLRREALERGVDAERVDPLQVFARDKWRCRLCGRATPKSKRGTYEADAPELDHIIPLSKNGSHTYLNTQCACRACNIKKSDKPMGQLLLIG